jgi:hypothetical protein
LRKNAAIASFWFCNNTICGAHFHGFCNQAGTGEDFLDKAGFFRDLFVPYPKTQNLKFMQTRFSLLFVFTLMLWAATSAFAQLNKPFPVLEGTTLKDMEVKLPDDVKGKYTLIGMAWSKKAEDDLESWFQPVYETFIYKPENPGIFDVGGGYDVNVYFIPMFTGAKRAVAGKVVKQMKKKTDPKLHAHTLVFKGKLNDYKDELDLEQKDTPYFFVLDDQGEIVLALSGAYSDARMEQVEDLLMEAEE